MRAGSVVMVSAFVAAALLLVQPALGGAAAAATVGSSSTNNCTSSCGSISIPYPFGLEPGCYHEGGFNLTCDHSYHPPKLFLGDGTVLVLDISIPNGTVRTNATNFHLEQDTGTEARATWRVAGLGMEAGPYFLAAGGQNNLVAIGCDVQVILLRENNTLVSSCAPFCPIEGDGYVVSNGLCTGIGCCQSTILQGRASYQLLLHPLGYGYSNKRHVDVIVVDSEYVPQHNDFYEENTLPAVLGWTIKGPACHSDSNGSSPSCRSDHSYCRNYTDMFGPQQSHHGHNCYCSDGYQGNPYISGGCNDINECDHPNTYPCYGDCKNTQGGYDCQCPPGFEGNASKENGCKDIDECRHPEAYPCYGICINLPGTFHCRCHDGTAGDPLVKQGCITIKRSLTGLAIGLLISGGSVILLLSLVAPLITRKIKLGRENKQKERFFKQNHGLLLEQLISQKADFGERMIIPLFDLQKATNNFDRTHEVGGGGHGVVYKGLLDLQVVAIKKSKIVVQREIDDFINEVAILSQINHRNVVKLIGCCLETEVPLLVYEFISNGTLGHHLHAEGTTSLSWHDRIRIALEVARAISYLHSAASVPIYHRDIKSSNILLDDNLTAKVSDFGASRYIPVDQTGVSTVVQGTFGYLDPMYYYTGRLTDKSDVFSFGVLLIELLTKKKPCAFRCGGGVGLVSHFASLCTEGNLNEIIDPQVTKELYVEVQEVAALATKCTKLKGEDRPTMREVEMTLEILRVTKRHSRGGTTSRRNDGDQIQAQNMSMEGVTEDTSRQYTMEEEMLMSARYPR